VSTLPDFATAWKHYEERGFRYGEDALEQVRLGYRIALEELQCAPSKEDELRQSLQAANENTRHWKARALALQAALDASGVTGGSDAA
jgi:hypothetical protein